MWYFTIIYGFLTCDCSGLLMVKTNGLLVRKFADNIYKQGISPMLHSDFPKGISLPGFQDFQRFLSKVSQKV